MASRPAPGLSPCWTAAGALTRRPVLAAFAFGAAIAVAGLAVGGAVAQGSLVAGQQIYDSSQRVTLTLMPLDPSAADEPRHRRDRITLVTKGEIAASPPLQSAVCVRLCDGYFFPLSAADDGADAQAAACNSLCPDAPTEVFYRSGSDRIEDSISADGQPYSELPVSLRYRSTADHTCVCHRDIVAYAPLEDVTLRRGDLIMTPAGFVMFRGPEGPKHQPGDFTALARTSVPAVLRGDLQAMERASLDKDRPTLRQWLASQTTPALAEHRIERVVARAPTGEGIRLLVWRGGAQD
jgi:hypothetical protein